MSANNPAFRFKNGDAVQFRSDSDAVPEWLRRLMAEIMMRDASQIGFESRAGPSDDGTFVYWVLLTGTDEIGPGREAWLEPSCS